MSGEVIEMPLQGNATGNGVRRVGAPVPSAPQPELMFRQLDTLVSALRESLDLVAIRAPAGAITAERLQDFLRQFGELEGEAVELVGRLRARVEGELQGIGQSIDLLQGRVEGFVQACEAATQYLQLTTTNTNTRGLGQGEETPASESKTRWWLWIGIGGAALGAGWLAWRAAASR